MLSGQQWPTLNPYNDVIMGAMASQITSLTIVYSTVYSGAHQKTSKLRVTGLCARNSPVTGEFPAQMASNVKNVSIWWRLMMIWIACGCIIATDSPRPPKRAVKYMFKVSPCCALRKTVTNTEKLTMPTLSSLSTPFVVFDNFTGDDSVGSQWSDRVYLKWLWLNCL